MRVIVATVFRIPHAGGASSHIELLVSMLRREWIIRGLICGNDLAPTLLAKLRYIVKRLKDADDARRWALEGSIDRMARLMAKAVAASDDKDLLFHCHDPLATYAALLSGIQGAAIIQTVHGP